MYKIAVTDDRFSGDYSIENDIFGSLNTKVTVYNLQSKEEGIEALKDADAILSMLFPLSDKIIGELAKCKVISRYGVGYDNLDVDAATGKGIWVARVPDFCIEDVSDHAVSLLFSCIRAVGFKDRSIRTGEWNVGAPCQISRIAGKTLGLIGFGNVARAMVRKMSGFNLGKILVFDPFVSESTCRELGVEQCNLTFLMSESDYISVHAPLNETTHHLLDAALLGKTKERVIIVNTSRGPVIDEAALSDLLQHSHRCAGLDVYENEPLLQDSLLKDLDNVVLTDHSAWYSQESFIDLKRKAARNILEVLNGGVPVYPVNEIGNT
jgi:D-3-phosphoglycerate dehydrogenase / 2-oxoglutarate reductase